MLSSSVRRGELDRQVTFIEAVITRGPSNQDKITGWSIITDGTVWARKQEGKGGEFVINNQVRFVRRTTFTIDYRDDIDTKMRLVHDTKVYDIQSISENGESRNRYLDIVCYLIDNEIYT